MKHALTDVQRKALLKIIEDVAIDARASFEDSPDYLEGYLDALEALTDTVKAPLTLSFFAEEIEARVKGRAS